MLYGDLMMKEILKDYINENGKMIRVILACLGIGVLVSCIMYMFLDEGLKNELINTLKNTLNLSRADNFESINVIKNGVIANAILIFVIYFCSITLIAPLLICTITFVKGFALAIYIPIIFQIFGFSKGLLVIFLLMILPNLIYLPSYIYTSINALQFHYKMYDTEMKNKVMSIFQEIIKIFIAFSLICLSVVIEQLISGTIMHIYSLL